ncbi:MAG: hypothetical protein JNK26_03970 [Candidatus Doudnabacteria bacterium]|nr:hypothetical protein [Candidatus Doudnabacteria bacterium]
MEARIHSLVKKLPVKSLLVWSLALVFIVFGALKIFDLGPVAVYVSEMVPLMASALAIKLLGTIELLLGVGLLIKKVRFWAAMAIAAHLMGIFLLSLLNLHLLLDQAGVTLFGEFVMKNIVLVATALFSAANADSQ